MQVLNFCKILTTLYNILNNGTHSTLCKVLYCIFNEATKTFQQCQYLSKTSYSRLKGFEEIRQLFIMLPKLERSQRYFDANFLSQQTYISQGNTRTPQNSAKTHLSGRFMEKMAIFAGNASFSWERKLIALEKHIPYAYTYIFVNL